MDSEKLLILVATMTGTALMAAEDIAEHISVPVLMVEVHPTHDRLEVGVVNLNHNR